MNVGMASKWANDLGKVALGVSETRGSVSQLSNSQKSPFTQVINPYLYKHLQPQFCVYNIHNHLPVSLYAIHSVQYSTSTYNYTVHTLTHMGCICMAINLLPYENLVFAYIYGHGVMYKAVNI